MQSKATTVAQYLAELPEDRRRSIEEVRRVIREHIDPAFQETMQYGMIGYNVPHSLYPAGYHCDPKQPLPFAALASQKNAMSLYLMFLYGSDAERADFEGRWAKTGKKLDMGKSCIRFKKAEDLALDVIATFFDRVTAKKYIESYERQLNRPRGATPPGALDRSVGAASAEKAAAPGKKTAKKAAKKVAKKSAKKIGKKVAARSPARPAATKAASGRKVAKER